MKKLRLFASALLASIVLGLSFGTSAQAACTPTGMMRDNINLTAALINPGNVLRTEVDATGCNIAIYYGPGAVGKVIRAKVHGSNYYGIVMSGAMVDVQYSEVYDIGEMPFNGAQHGVAIYCDPNSPQAAGGRILQNRIHDYQKGGIVFNGANCKGRIDYNIVSGLGPVDFIAQNGIQRGYGNDVVLYRNMISGHSYTGANQASSGGILLIGGPCFGAALQSKNSTTENTLIGNDVGIYDLNLDANCTAAPHAPLTKNVVRENVIYTNVIDNTTGNGTAPYQAGISVAAAGDIIKDNVICGGGYSPTHQPAGGLIANVDSAGSYKLSISNNRCAAAKDDVVASMQMPTSDSMSVAGDKRSTMTADPVH